MTALKPRPGIMNIAPYVAGGSTIEGFERVIKLASNESALGPSPMAMEAFNAMSDQIHLYPDGNCTALREAIGKTYNIDLELVFCSAGSDQSLRMLARAYCGPGDEVLFGQYGFVVYRMAAHGTGATPVTVEEPGHRIDVSLLLDAITDKTRLIYLANPGNPTGSYITEQELRRLVDGIPDNVLLVIDAAYADYISREDYDVGFRFVEENRGNVVVARTLSKLHGLASLRVGWTYAPAEVISVLQRLRGGFNVNGAAQAAGVAALADHDFVERARAHNDEWLPKLTNGIEEAGFPVTPSVANFVLMHFPGGPEEAQAANAHLQQRGIIVRPVANYKLPASLRVTVGRAEENFAFLAALQEFASNR